MYAIVKFSIYSTDHAENLLLKCRNKKLEFNIKGKKGIYSQNCCYVWSSLSGLVFTQEKTFLEFYWKTKCFVESAINYVTTTIIRKCTCEHLVIIECLHGWK